MNSPDPIPRDFGWRYILWMIWSNAITILAALQGIFVSVLLVSDDPTNPMLPHYVVRWIVLGNAVLTGVVAQLKRNSPPGPPPVKASS